MLAIRGCTPYFATPTQDSKQMGPVTVGWKSQNSDSKETFPLYKLVSQAFNHKPRKAPWRDSEIFIPAVNHPLCSTPRMSTGNPSQARWHAKSIESSNTVVLLSRVTQASHRKMRVWWTLMWVTRCRLVAISNSERPEGRSRNKLREWEILTDQRVHTWASWR